MAGADVCEVVTHADGTEERRPLKRIEPPLRPALTDKQARALRNLILLKLLTSEGRW